MTLLRSLIRVLLIFNAFVGVGCVIVEPAAERIGWIVGGPFGEAQVIRIEEMGADPGFIVAPAEFDATFAFIGAILLGIVGCTGSKWALLLGAILLAAVRIIYDGGGFPLDYGLDAILDWTAVFLAIFSGFIVGRYTLPFRSRPPVTLG